MQEPQTKTNKARRVRLKGSSSDLSAEKRMKSWHNAMEKVIQSSIGNISDLRATENKVLESMIFCQCLSSTASEWIHDEKLDQPALELFSKPMSMFVFELINRQYICTEMIHQDKYRGVSADSMWLKSRDAIFKTSQILSSVNVDLPDVPNTEELMLTLLDHLLENFKNEGEELAESPDPKTVWKENFRHKVHSARRSALRNWQARLKQVYETAYEHDENEHGMFCYPYVDAIAPDGVHLLLIFLSPLDMNFVDNKVSDNNRVPEITIGLYDVSNLMYPGAVHEAVPYVRHAFGRLLFSNMLGETDAALAETTQERSTVLRNWAKIASNGLTGILSREQAKAPFDPFVFCEALVKKALCANITGVDRTEIYPFNRAFVFREAGASSSISQEPIEMMVLESSILSNNPADRGRYLTARERRIRGTEDYECNPAYKKVTDENVMRFYIMEGDDRSLILSRKPELDTNLKQSILLKKWKSRNSEQAENAGYSIKLPDIDDADNDEIHAAIYNLFGRIIKNARIDKYIPDPLDPEKKYQVKTFSEEFERMRLNVLDRFDESGLYFCYDHGIDLKKNCSLLNELQSAYFSYLNDRFQEMDRNYLKDRYRQDNMTEEQINEILESHYHLNKMEEDPEKNKKTGQAHVDIEESAKRGSKIVLISFSWVLHDENMQFMVEDANAEAQQDALLGKEYNYTIVLVADQEQEKSVARVESEREDLNMFFQILMRQIWSDKLTEHEYLDKRSRSISGSLSQFFHRVKGMVPTDRKKEIDDFINNLRVLMETRRTKIEEINIFDPNYLFERLTGETNEGHFDQKAFAEYLQDQIAKWTENKTDCQVEVLPSFMPALKLVWADAIVRDAFTVAFKNAVEAALKDSEQNPTIYVQLQATPDRNNAKWFVDVVIDNPGGPLPSDLLEKLNAPVPVAVSKNENKSSSTGIGVFISRYQLQEVIRMGADMTISNVGKNRVQTRIRLPGSTVAVARQSAKPVFEKPMPDKNYVLYVEDSPAIYTQAIQHMEPLVQGVDLNLEHSRSATGGIEMLNQRMPFAILTDIFILRYEEDNESANSVNGKEFLEHALRMANSEKVFPPIWIFTHEEEGTVREMMDQSLLGEYQFFIWDKTEFEQLIRPKTIVVFSGEKHPNALPEDLLSLLFHSYRETPAEGKTVKKATGKTKTETNLKIKNLSMENGTVPDQIHTARKWTGRPVDIFLLVEAKCSRIDDLAGTLHAWFQHDGIVDPDPFTGRNKNLRKLCDRAYHRHLLLSLAVGKRTHAKLPPKLLYWGLKNNLWFCISKQKPEDLANTWLQILQDGKGPISYLRHELKNDLEASHLSTDLNHLLELLWQSEQLLETESSFSHELERLLMDERKSDNVIADYLIKPEQNTTLKEKIRQTFSEIAWSLQKAGEKDESVREKTDNQIQRIQILQNYLGGN